MSSNTAMTHKFPILSCYFSNVTSLTCTFSQVLAVVHKSALGLRHRPQGLPEAQTVQSPVPGPAAEKWSLASLAAVFTIQQGSPASLLRRHPHASTPLVIMAVKILNAASFSIRWTAPSSVCRRNTTALNPRICATCWRESSSSPASRWAWT